MAKTPTPKADELDEAIVAAILELREKADTIEIHLMIEKRVAPKTVFIEHIYSGLSRLEIKRIVTSWLADPTFERGWRRKRFYKVVGASGPDPEELRPPEDISPRYLKGQGGAPFLGMRIVDFVMERLLNPRIREHTVGDFVEKNRFKKSLR